MNYLPTAESRSRDLYYFNDPAKKPSWRDKETPLPPKPFDFRPSSALPEPIRWSPTSSGSFPLPGPWAEVFRVPDSRAPPVFNPYKDQLQPHRESVHRDRVLRDLHFANRRNFEASLLTRSDPLPSPMARPQAQAFVRWTNNYGNRAANARTRQFEYLAYRHLGRGQGQAGVSNFKASVFRTMTPLRKYAARKAQASRRKRATNKIRYSPGFNAGVRRWYQGKVRQGAGKFIATKLGAAYRARKVRAAMGLNPFAVPYVSDAALTAAAERAEAEQRPQGINPFAVPYVSDADLIRAAAVVEAAAEKKSRVKSKLASKTAVMRAARNSLGVSDFDLMAAGVDDPYAPKGAFVPSFNPPSRKRPRDYDIDMSDAPAAQQARYEAPDGNYGELDDPAAEFYFPEEPADDSVPLGDLTPFADPVDGMDITGSGAYRLRPRYRYPRYRRPRFRRYY